MYLQWGSEPSGACARGFVRSRGSCSGCFSSEPAAESLPCWHGAGSWHGPGKARCWARESAGQGDLSRVFLLLIRATRSLPSLPVAGILQEAAGAASPAAIDTAASRKAATQRGELTQMGSGPSDLAPNIRGTSTEQGVCESQHPRELAGRQWGRDMGAFCSWGAGAAGPGAGSCCSSSSSLSAIWHVR